MNRGTQVVICRVCSEGAGLLDVDKLARVASDAPGVCSTVVVDRACNKKTVLEMVDDAMAKEADRLLVAPCSKKEISPALFQTYAKKAKMNEFLMEAVDIIGEVTLPHREDPTRVQSKAEARLQSAIVRINMLEPLQRAEERMRTSNVVVIGAGVAGIEAASVASAFGLHTVIIEKSEKKIDAPGVVMPKSRLISAKGHAGNYILTIEVGEKRETLECAAIVVASGGDWSEAKGPIVDELQVAKPLHHLEQEIGEGRLPGGAIVILDTPDPKGSIAPAQDFMWEEALICATHIRRKSPTTEVYLVFQEMRAMGLAEFNYKEASELGVKFVRYDSKKPPKVDTKTETRLIVTDMTQEEILSLAFDALYYASVAPNPDNVKIADALRIPISSNGGIRRGSIQRGPVATPRPGIFVCGTAKFPKSGEIARLEGRAAGLMAAQFAAAGKWEFGGSVAEVTSDNCSACLTCVRTCPYEAPFIGTAGKAEIATQMCQGCGTCVGVCPSKAIELHNYTDDQLSAETAAYLGGDF